jgi:hypothetical protein
MRIQGAKPIRIHADPDPGHSGQTLLTFQKTHGTYAVTKAIWKGWKSGLFVSFGQFPCSGSAFLIRIRIQRSQIDANPYPKHRFFFCCSDFESGLC